MTSTIDYPAPVAAGNLIGAVLDGRYKVLEAVAEGAMGVVYRAERVKLGRIVAVKVLHEHIPSELSGRKRFEIEAMAMAKLEHPHCAAVVDVGVHEDIPFVVMDFVSGENLKELIAAGPVAVPRAIEIVRQTLSGLAHAHEHGIIHRDIKPANIVLSQKSGLGDHVKILDFGLARLTADVSNLTTGIVVGTPSYMAPEQIRGTAIDKRADIYAVGVLLFELVTGKKPFFSPKDDPIEVCSMHLKKKPPTLAETLPGDYGALEAVVAKALSKSPDDRYASAEEMAAALVERRSAPFTPPAGVPVVPVKAPFRPTKQQLAIGGGALVVVVILIAVIAARGKADPVALPPDAAVAQPITIDKGDPVGDVLSRANEAIANGRRESAIDLLAGARRTFPDDARLAYLLGKLYFAKLWYTDGLRHLRDAVRLDPVYKSDPELIKTVLKGFITTPRFDSSLAGFLHDHIGAPAKPFLEETAENHPNPSIRARAAAELRRY
jgi:eukaryotic-like serine/threonine-protein kinase